MNGASLGLCVIILERGRIGDLFTRVARRGNSDCQTRQHPGE